MTKLDAVDGGKDVQPSLAPSGQQTSAEVAALVRQLRADAKSLSSASKMLVDAKTKRNVAAGEEGSYYEYIQPEQTTEWRAAELIELLTALRTIPEPHCWFIEPSNKHISTGPFSTKEEAITWRGISAAYEDWQPFPLYRSPAMPEPAHDSWRQIAMEKEREIAHQGRIIEKLRKANPDPAQGVRVTQEIIIHTLYVLHSIRNAAPWHSDIIRSINTCCAALEAALSPIEPARDNYNDPTS